MDKRGGSVVTAHPDDPAYHDRMRAVEMFHSSPNAARSPPRRARALRSAGRAGADLSAKVDRLSSTLSRAFWSRWRLTDWRPGLLEATIASIAVLPSRSEPVRWKRGRTACDHCLTWGRPEQVATHTSELHVTCQIRTRPGGTCQPRSTSPTKPIPARARRRPGASRYGSACRGRQGP